MLQHDRPVSVVKSNARRSDEALKIIAPQSDQRCTNYHELDNIYPKGSSKSHHHLKINEGPVSRGRTQPTHENASSRPPQDPRSHEIATRLWSLEATGSFHQSTLLSIITKTQATTGVKTWEVSSIYCTVQLVFLFFASQTLRNIKQNIIYKKKIPAM